MTPLRKVGAVGAYLVLCVALAIAIAGVPTLGREEVAAGPSGTAAVTTSTTTTTPASADASTTTTAAARPPGEVKVRLYNGSKTGGAAVTVGKRLQAQGYDVLEPGPSPADPASATTIWFAEGWAAEGAQVAEALGLAAAASAPLPRDPPVRGVGVAVVVVVVAEDVVSPA